MTIFALFTFLELHNIRGTYSKYFQNFIYESDVSSGTQRSTTICSFAGVLCTLNVCNRYLHLE